MNLATSHGVFVVTVPGDEALLRAVHAEHGRAMQLHATRLLGDQGLAEDVVQEALIRVWRHREVVSNGKGSLRGWLLTVVHNLAVDRIRQRKARPAEVAESPIHQPVSRDHADAVVTSHVVYAAMDTLSSEHRAVVEQVYLRGRNLDEVANVLGVPKGTVKSRAHYALRALRRAMQEDTPVEQVQEEARGWVRETP